MAFSSTTFLQGLPTVFVVEINPITEQRAHSADPDLPWALFQEQQPQVAVGLLLVEVVAVVQVDPLDWDAFSDAGFRECGRLLAEHLPDDGLSVIDGCGHTFPQVGVQVVDHVHDFLANWKRKFVPFSQVLLGLLCAHWLSK